jgi:hypothetical protein
MNSSPAGLIILLTFQVYSLTATGLHSYAGQPFDFVLKFFPSPMISNTTSKPANTPWV